MPNTDKVEGNDTDVEGKPSVYDTLSAPNPLEFITTLFSFRWLTN